MIGPILVAIEEQANRKHFVEVLTNLNFRVIEAESGIRALEICQRKTISLTLIDVEMSDLNGEALINQMRAFNVSTPIVAITRGLGEDNLMAILKAGATDFISIDATALRIAVTSAAVLQRSAFAREVNFVRGNAECHITFADYVSKSAAMTAMLKSARTAAATDKNLFIYGEPATGRETIARTIHREGIFSGGPFIRVQCASNFDEREFETRWIKELDDKIDASIGGSLCLFNVDRLTPRQQQALVDALRRKHRPMSRKSIASVDSPTKIADDKCALCSIMAEYRMQSEQSGVNARHWCANQQSSLPFRLIAISTTPFDELAKSPVFAKALWRTLNGFFVNVPPLRQRRDDLPEIAKQFVETIILETGLTNVAGLSGVAIALLTQHQWPGNLSELYQLLFRAVLLGSGPILNAQDFPQLISPATSEIVNDSGNLLANKEDGASAFFTQDQHIKPMQQIEKEAIELAMKRYNKRISEISRRLKIGRSTLYRKMEEYSLID